MKTAHLVKEFNTLISEHEKKLEEIAEKVRQEVVIPYCKKNNCEYFSGMGTFFFSDITTGYHTDIDCVSSNKVHKLLCMDINYNRQLGDYVQNVREADLQ